MLFPSLDPFYATIEKTFVVTYQMDLFYQALFPFLVTLAAVYLILCFATQRFMRDRLPFDLKRPLALWNLSLAIFSFIGAFRMVPHIGYSVYRYGHYYSLCENGLYQASYGAIGFWCTAFVYSKIPELFDTAFIVLRKKKLAFLHYYHHISVMFFVWHGYSMMSPIGIYFIAINYSVHSVMYFYYFLTAIGYRPRWAYMVTALQLSQMAFGIAANAYVYFLQYQGTPCIVADATLTLGTFVYATYFLLFLKFFLDRFVFKSTKKNV